MPGGKAFATLPGLFSPFIVNNVYRNFVNAVIKRYFCELEYYFNSLINITH